MTPRDKSNEFKLGSLTHTTISQAHWYDNDFGTNRSKVKVKVIDDERGLCCLRFAIDI